MLSIIPKFNLQTSQTEKSKSTSPINTQLHSQPMADTVSFKGLERVAETILTPTLADITTHFGKPFIENVEYRGNFTSTELFKPSEAKQIIESVMQSRKENMELLQSYNPDNIKEWLSKFVESADSYKYDLSSKKTDYVNYEQHGKFQPFLRDLVSGINEDENRVFLEVRDRRRNPLVVQTPSNWRFVKDDVNRAGSEMAEYLDDVVIKDKKSIITNINGVDYSIVPHYESGQVGSCIYGVKMVPATKI